MYEIEIDKEVKKKCKKQGRAMLTDVSENGVKSVILK